MLTSPLTGPQAAGTTAPAPRPRRVRVELVAVAVVGLAVWLALAWLLYVFGVRGHGADSAFVAQIFFNFKTQPWMESSLVSSILDAQKTLWYRPAAFVCAQPLVFQAPNTPLTFHLYLIGYLLLPLARVLPPDALIAGLTALIYVSIPVFAYLLARSLKISVLNAGLIALLVVQHPLWQQGFFGQFYFNKLFLPLCALLIWLLERKRINHRGLWLVALLAASTTEIYGLVVAVLLVGVVLIRRRGWLELLPLAAACAAFSVAGMAFTQVSGGSSSTQDGVISSTVGGGLAGFVANRVHALTTGNWVTFVMVNAAELGLLAFGSLGHLALAALLMLPNLLVTVGGAEKTGWSTHYHVNYWIPLIWAGVIGASKLQARSGVALSAITVGMVGLSSVLNPSTLALQAPVFTPVLIGQKLRDYSLSAPAEFAYREALRAAVPPGASVSGPEPIFYDLVDHPLSYYPLNVDSADRVIFVFDPTQANDARFHTVNYGQQDSQLDACIVGRMRSDGFDFDHPTIVDQWAIVGRGS